MNKAVIIFIAFGAYSAGIMTGLVMLEQEYQDQVGYVDPCSTGEQIDGCIKDEIVFPEPPQGGQWSHLQGGNQSE